ncbi:MAG: GNAT family N-acetyltransferase [Dehalococcoidia bacterium]|nr:GNAT family N-acetyltransferase [Dehalococcoidia bacterium]
MRLKGFKIRQFTMGDYNQVAHIWDVANVPSPEGRKEVQRRTERDPDLFLVADLNGTVIGVVMGAWDGRRAWCHNYGVDPQFRGQGVGSALIKELEGKVQEKGIPRLNAMVRRGDASSQGFYEAVGFHKEDWEIMEWNTP